MGSISKLNERKLISLVEDGQLQIDDQGRIWRVMVRKGDSRNGGSRIFPCKRRRAEHRTPQGYLQIRAMTSGTRIHCAAHRLVWQHVNGNIPEGHEINHRNGIKDDNRPTNLLSGTPGENVSHAHQGGLIDQYGQRNPAAKLTDNEVAQIRLAYSQGGYTMVQLGDRFNVTFQTISRIIRGQRRAKQGGPISKNDLRHMANDKDSSTGQFISKKKAGHLLDGEVIQQYPGDV